MNVNITRGGKQREKEKENRKTLPADYLQYLPANHNSENHHQNSCQLTCVIKY